MDYQNYIIRDPSFDELLEDFPTLEERHVRAVIAFAAASAEEDLPLKSLPQIS
jgi:uncharacterized protein (DUF433 family)